MEENKILFQVISQGEGTAVQCHTESTNEIFQVALAFHSILINKPKFAAALAFIASMYNEDPNFGKALDEATVDMPDFDSLLKNIK